MQEGIISNLPALKRTIHNCPNSVLGAGKQLQLSSLSAHVAVPSSSLCGLGDGGRVGGEQKQGGGELVQSADSFTDRPRHLPSEHIGPFTSLGKAEEKLGSIEEGGVQASKGIQKQVVGSALCISKEK